MAQIRGRKRPHWLATFLLATFLLATFWLAPFWPAVPKPTDPWVNSRPAHCFLKTPLRGPPPAAFGNSAVARLFQVICGTMASIR